MNEWAKTLREQSEEAEEWASILKMGSDMAQSTIRLIERTGIQFYD